MPGPTYEAGRSSTCGLDVTDAAAVREVFEAHRPRVVVHAAALVDDRGDPALFETGERWGHSPNARSGALR